MQTIEINNPLLARVVRARAFLLRSHPFFGNLAMRLRIREHNELRVKTMATDGTFLYWCREFLEKVSDSMLLFAVAHEVLHCALCHHTRRGTRDPLLWNIACDHVVNLLLRAAGFRPPDWAYCDPKYTGLNAEQVYRLLYEERKQQQQQQPEPTPQPGQDDQQATGSGDQDPDQEADPKGGSPGDDDEEGDEGEEQCGSNGGASSDQDSKSGSDSEDGTSGTSTEDDAPQDAGSSSEGGSAGSPTSDSSDGTPGRSGLPQSHGDPGGCGEVLDAAPSYDDTKLSEAEGEWQTYVRQAINVARKAGEGRLPGFLEEVIDTLNDPRTDWRQALREWVDYSNTKDYTWTTPNRRMFALGYITPGMVSDGLNKVAFIIDSSGSVHTEWLKKFGGEAQAALDDGAIDNAIVIFADDGIHRIEEYSKGDIIDWTVQGRGGTSFSPALGWLMENVPDLSGAVYFTDLDSTDFGPQPTFPLLWAAYGPDPNELQRLIARLPFGECIELVD